MSVFFFFFFFSSRRRHTRFSRDWSSDVCSSDLHGWGLTTVVTSGASEGTVLDTWFPAPALGEAPAAGPAPEALERLARDHAVRRVRTEVRHVAIDLADPPAEA